MQTRYTGIDNANVDFDRRPLGNVQIVPCWIARVCEVDEGLET